MNPISEHLQRRRNRKMVADLRDRGPKDSRGGGENPPTATVPVSNPVGAVTPDTAPSGTTHRRDRS